MLSTRTIAVLVALPVLAAVAIVATPTVVDAQAIPDDFKIVAQYGPGFSSWCPWKCTITSDGKVLQEVKKGRTKGEQQGPGPYEKRLTLTKNDVNALMAKVKEADFFSLQKSYTVALSDASTQYLEITMSKQTHKVSVYGFQLVLGPENINEVDRFLSIWLEVLAKVPSPNPERLELMKAGISSKNNGPKPPADPRLRATIYAEISNAAGNVALSPDGSKVAWCSNDGNVRVADAASGKIIGFFDGTKEEKRQCVAFSTDSKTVAMGYDKGTNLWDVASGRNMLTLSGDHGGLISVAFSPAAKIIAGSGGKTVQLWETATGKHLATCEGHAGAVTALAFSPNGKTLASGGADNTVRVWDVASGKNIVTMEVNSHNAVRCVAFSPDGKLIASCGKDKSINMPKGKDRDQTVKLWDAATGKNIATLEGHTRELFAVAFSPDGKTLASGGFDQCIKFWDVATLTCRTTLPVSGHSTTYLAYSRDGTVLASGATRMILLWDVKSIK